MFLNPKEDFLFMIFVIQKNENYDTYIKGYFLNKKISEFPNISLTWSGKEKNTT